MQQLELPFVTIDDPPVTTTRIVCDQELLKARKKADDIMDNIIKEISKEIPYGYMVDTVRTERNMHKGGKTIHFTCVPDMRIMYPSKVYD